MRHASLSPHHSGFARRFSNYSGVFFDEFGPDSAWIRDTATLQLPPLPNVSSLVIRGEFRPHPAAHGLETTTPTLLARINGHKAGLLRAERSGNWEMALAVPKTRAITLTLRLGGVGYTNLLAWLGRLTGVNPLQRFRAQNKNRQLRINRIETDRGEIVYDFSNRHAPYSIAFARQHLHLGLNIVGFLTADLGVGESSRCMVRAADAAQLPSALVPLKLHCKNRLGDQTYAARLQAENPHAVNVIHLDPPSSHDLKHHHGAEFLTGKYNIAYWAWELPEFPDGWVPCVGYFNEIWCPSDFTREAIALKSSVPVLTMPHAISFVRPEGSFRSRFGLPVEKFLFLFVYDLNSYSARKNPEAAIAAFRKSGLAERGAALVVKVQNHVENPADLAALQKAFADLPDSVLLTETLSRREVYELESACDCFVSLHRAEGFGLAVAECMYLGKPVIATDWSATAEYLNRENGCPVDFQLVALERNHGPYMKGSSWADADVAHAAEWMRKLFADRELAERLGAAARATIETRFSPAAIGARYRKRLESIAWF